MLMCMGFLVSERLEVGGWKWEVRGLRLELEAGILSDLKSLLKINPHSIGGIL